MVHDEADRNKAAKAEFEPSMIGNPDEVTIIHNRQTGSNYYNTQKADVSREVHAGRLASYASDRFTFEPIGTASAETVYIPRPTNGWPDSTYRLEIQR